MSEYTHEPIGDDERSTETHTDTSGAQHSHAPLTPTDEAQRLSIQVEIILNSLDGAATYPPGRPDEMEYLYIEGRILVRDADIERVQAVVPGQVVDGLVNGLSAFAPVDLGTVEALERIDAVLGVGVATPDHIFYVTPASGCCPATEPIPAYGGPYPALVPAETGDGDGVVLAVVDTGFIHRVGRRHPWLAGVTGDEEYYDPEDIGPYVGHGTFVAGVVRSVAPDAHIHIDGILTHGGAVSESDILTGLYEAVRRTPDVISMSAGCTTRHNLPPLGFEVLWDQRLRHSKGTVLVAAAGNNDSRRPFWPAAYEWAVSVGALETDGSRATFSDYGSWVDVYALGRDIVNAYPDGWYNYKEPPHLGERAEFTTGLALWSGTSFSTPMVAGMIAARMSRTGQSGRAAADSILRIAQANARAGVGPIAEAGAAFDDDPRGY